MKIPDFELPLIVAQMEKIAGQNAALEKSKGDLQNYLLARFGVDILNGNWSIDPATGELNEVQGPDNGRPSDPDRVG